MKNLTENGIFNDKGFLAPYNVFVIFYARSRNLLCKLTSATSRKTRFNLECDVTLLRKKSPKFVESCPLTNAIKPGFKFVYIQFEKLFVAVTLIIPLVVNSAGSSKRVVKRFVSRIVVCFYRLNV